VLTRKRERIKRNREKFIEYKKTLSCEHCGLDDYRLLDFHHVGDKKNAVSRMIGDGWSWEKIADEIAKCIPLCSNCHRLEHYKLVTKEEDNAFNQYQATGSILVRLHW
jgi:hypothetical protein